MNIRGNYTLHLYDMKDKIVYMDGKAYVFLSVIAQRLKNVDSPDASTLYRRWFQLTQFTFSVKEVYGLLALDLTDQVKEGHVSSLKVMCHTQSGKDRLDK